MYHSEEDMDKVPKRSIESSRRQPKSPYINISGSSLRQKGDTILPIKAGGYREKVVLKPGHSALDWSIVTNTKGSKGLLVTGITSHIISNYQNQLDGWLQHFIELQHPSSLEQLRMGVPTFKIHPPLRIDDEIMMDKRARESYWCILRGKVYCLSSYLDFHPGGEEILIKNCIGKDATKLFDGYHRWINLEKLLGTCLVGIYSGD